MRNLFISMRMCERENIVGVYLCLNVWGGGLLTVSTKAALPASASWPLSFPRFS